MEKVYFTNVPNIGDLSLEKVLFSYENIPIVFICKNNMNEKFLCLCNDVIEEECWMVSKISVSKLLDILYDKITIFNAFKTSDNNIIIATRSQDHIIYQEKAFDEIDELDLPDENEYLEMQQYLKDYISDLNNTELLSQIALVLNDVCHNFFLKLRVWEIDNIIIEKTNANHLNDFKKNIESESLYDKSSFYKSSVGSPSDDFTVSISDDFYFAA